MDMAATLVFVSLLGFAITERGYNGTYTNPVVSSNHPDPGILALPSGKGYVVVSTSNNANPSEDAFPIMFSEDLVNWKLKGYVFNGGKWPIWVRSDTWAPEIHFVNGKFHIYYSALTVSDSRFALGLAISTIGPFGPYKDLGRPLMNESAIDPTWFCDPKTNKTFLSWKKQADNPFMHNSHIQIQQVEEDGITFTPSTTPKTLITSTFFGDLLIVEGPWIIYKDPYYFLFFSTSDTSLPTYNIKVARSQDILGPYKRWEQRVIAWDASGCFRFNCTLIGPGHGSLVQLPNGDYWLVYHAWLARKFFSESPGRVLNIDKIEWSTDNWPFVGNPSSTPTPAPKISVN